MVCFLKVFLLWQPMAFGSWKVGERTGVTLQAWQLACEEDIWTESWRCVLVFCFFFPKAINALIGDNFSCVNNFQNRIWAWGLMGLRREEKMTETWFQKTIEESLNPVETSDISAFQHLCATESKCLDTIEQIIPLVAWVRKQAPPVCFLEWGRGYWAQDCCLCFWSRRAAQTCSEDCSGEQHTSSELGPCLKQQPISDLVCFFAPPFSTLPRAEMILDNQ